MKKPNDSCVPAEDMPMSNTVSSVLKLSRYECSYTQNYFKVSGGSNKQRDYLLESLMEGFHNIPTLKEIRLAGETKSRQLPP